MFDSEEYQPICIKELLEKYHEDPDRCVCPKCKAEREKENGSEHERSWLPRV